MLLVANSRYELGARVSRSVRERVDAVLSGGEQALKDGGQAMSNAKDKLRDKIDDTADAAKKTVDKVVDKSQDLAHNAGEQLEQGGKRLQNA